MQKEENPHKLSINKFVSKLNLFSSTGITKETESLGVCKRMSRMSIGRRKLLHVKSHTVKSYTAT